MKHFKVKKLKITSKSEKRVLVKARPAPKVDKSDVKKKSSELSRRVEARERYRREHNVILSSCADNLDQLGDLAKMHSVTFPNGSVRSIPAFTITAMGEPLGTTGVTVTRWVNSMMIPAPVLETSRGKVYHLEEARAMVRIIGEHQRSFRQYRAEHKDVCEHLFAEVRRIRDGIFKPK